MNFQGHRNEFAAVNEHELSRSPTHVSVLDYFSDFIRTWMFLHSQLFLTKSVCAKRMDASTCGAHTHTWTHGWLQFCVQLKGLFNEEYYSQYWTHHISSHSAMHIQRVNVAEKNNRITWTNDRPPERTTMRMQREKGSGSSSKHTEIYASKYYKLKHIFPILFSCWRTAVGIVPCKHTDTLSCVLRALLSHRERVISYSILVDFGALIFLLFSFLLVHKTIFWFPFLWWLMFECIKTRKETVNDIIVVGCME